MMMMMMMDDKRIEDILRMLENGEISCDEMESDGEDLDDYPIRQELLDELDKSQSHCSDEDVIGDGGDDEVNYIEPPGPPLVADVDENAPSSSSQITYIPAGRNLLWRKRNMKFSEDKIAFIGSEELSSNVLELQTPYQFFSYFFRLGKSCKLPSKKEVMASSVPRGAYVEYVTNIDDVEIASVSWKDNKQVVLTSTYVGAEPAETIERYDKKTKQRIRIACPKLVKDYNAHMGGVDLMDSHLGRYRIHIKSRKWYIRIFYHLLDLSIINAWILYRKTLLSRRVPNKDIMNLANFRSDRAETLCKYSTPTPRGRPSASAIQEEGPPAKMRKGKPCQVLPPRDVILDGVGHEQIRTPDRMRCMFPSCKLKTVTMCSKCKVHLCAKKSKDCFNELHRK